MGDVNSAAAQASRTALFNQAVAQPIPANAIVMVVSNNCPHCRTLMEQTGYQSAMPNGRPVVWIDTASQAGAAKLDSIPGMAYAPHDFGGSIGTRNVPTANGVPILSVPRAVTLQEGRVSGFAEVPAIQSAMNYACPAGGSISAADMRAFASGASAPTVGSCPPPASAAPRR